MHMYVKKRVITFFFSFLNLNLLVFFIPKFLGWDLGGGNYNI